MIHVRIDDVGASSKQFEQHGKKWLRCKGKRIFYFPFANVWFFKRIPPFKGWGRYDELTGVEWRELLKVFAEEGVKPVIAITAAWVERDGALVPFPEKFPDEAEVLKSALHEGKIEIANHGLTHCIIGQHLPRFFSSNRRAHREFWPELDQELHDTHVRKSQEILENFFEQKITIFVPPGNVWSKKTYRALQGTSIRRITCSTYMQDSEEALEGIEFISDRGYSLNLHDRELKLYGPEWLRKTLREAKKV